MNKPSVTIQLHEEKTEFVPGNWVKGNVVITTETPLTVKSVKVHLIATVEERFWGTDIPVCSSLTPGKHSLPFALILPMKTFPPWAPVELGVEVFTPGVFSSNPKYRLPIQVFVP